MQPETLGEVVTEVLKVGAMGVGSILAGTAIYMASVPGLDRLATAYQTRVHLVDQARNAHTSGLLKKKPNVFNIYRILNSDKYWAKSSQE